MSSAANGHATTRAINDLVATFDQFTNIAKSRSAVGICKQYIVSTYMAQTVRNTATFAPVLSQRHDAEDMMKVMFLRKVENYLNSLIFAAIVDHDNLVAARRSRRLCVGMALLVGASTRLCRG